MTDSQHDNCYASPSNRIIGGANRAPINGAAVLGNFSVIAATNQLTDSDFAAQATRNGGPTAGTKVDNVGRISVPIPEMSALLPIISVCGAGFAASIPSFLRRRKKA